MGHVDAWADWLRCPDKMCNLTLGSEDVTICCSEPVCWLPDGREAPGYSIGGTQGSNHHGTVSDLPEIRCTDGWNGTANASCDPAGYDDGFGDPYPVTARGGQFQFSGCLPHISPPAAAADRGHETLPQQFPGPIKQCSIRTLLNSLYGEGSQGFADLAAFRSHCRNAVSNLKVRASCRNERTCDLLALLDTNYSSGSVVDNDCREVWLGLCDPSP